MKIIFMGATEFGYRCLSKLLEIKGDVIAIYSIPQNFKISYSKKLVKISTYRDFKGISERFKIPFFEVNGNMNDYKEKIKKLNPDLILVIGWYYMIPESIIKIPKLGCVGIHNSLLPKYRGGAPLVWALINGEKKAGVSFFYFDKGVDNGDIITQKEILITKKDTIKTVYEKATKITLKILEEYIPLIKINKAPKIKQNEKNVTYFPQRKPEDGLIDWNKNSLEIYNFIRAQTKPYPGSFFYDKEGNKIKVWKANVINNKRKIKKEPGIIFRKGKNLIVSTKNGFIRIGDWEIKDE